MTREGKLLYVVGVLKPSEIRVAATARLLAVYLLVLALAGLSRPTPGSVSLGFVFVAAGETVRFWAAGHLRKTVELATGGPYRHTRNPLYLGRLLIFTGVCLMATLPHLVNLGVLALGWVVFFAYYLPRKERVEPERLRRRHGPAYERYHRTVPALFPAIVPYPDKPSAPWSSERLVRNREHWMVVGLTVLTLILLWRAYHA